MEGAIRGGRIERRSDRGLSIETTRPFRPVSPADPHDAGAVVRRVLDGDREAFGILVEREAPALVRICQRILGNQQEAEDAAQEAFVIAYRSLATWRGEGTFSAWLGRIATRVALREAGRRRTVAWVDPLGDAAEPRSTVAPTTAALDPAHLAVRSERAASVRAAVGQLDEPYREIVALRFFAELSLAEIAEQMRRPLGTVKTQLHRGLRRLREDLTAGEAHR